MQVVGPAGTPVGGSRDGRYTRHGHVYRRTEPGHAGLLPQLSPGPAELATTGYNPLSRSSATTVSSRHTFLVVHAVQPVCVCACVRARAREPLASAGR